MKRVVTALGGGLLALGLAASAGIAGMGAAGAVTTPTITGISVNTGPSTGGTSVTVTGTGFTSTTAVKFGPCGKYGSATGSPCAAGKVTSPGSGGTSVTVLTPAGLTGAQPVSVWNGTTSSASSQTFTFTFAGAITVNGGKSTGGGAGNLSLLKTNSLAIAGKGWTGGDNVIVTICNSDAALPDPSAQLGNNIGALLAGQTVTTDACAPTSLANNVTAVTSSGTFSIKINVNPGQEGTNSLSECPPSAAQVAEGVACIVGVAELAGTGPDGNTGFAALWFSTPAQSNTDTYSGESTANTPSAAQYNVDVNVLGTATESGYPPVASANGIPNNGSFATQGIICATGTGPGTSNPCNPEFSSPGVLKGCQASSSQSGKAWAGETLCSFGAAAGEPIELFLNSYAAPSTETSDTSAPLTPSTSTPFNCNESGCSASANAGYGVSNPGGVNAPLEAVTGLTGAASPITVGPGHYVFNVVGGGSLDHSGGSITLLPGPAS